MRLGPLAQMRVPTGPTVTPPSCLGLSTPLINILKQKDLPLRLKEGKVTLRPPPRVEGWGLSLPADGTSSWAGKLGQATCKPFSPSPPIPAFSTPSWGLGIQSNLAPHPSPQNLTSHFRLTVH